MKPVIKIFRSPLELAESLAVEFVNLIKKAGKETSPFTTAVSGGNTPKLFFSVLGDRFANDVNWDNVHFFWVDERCVPPSDNESNFGMTNKVLLGKIRIPGANIHRIRGEDDPVKESARYESELMQFTSMRNGLPCINLMFLGLGEDGHTASIFPGKEEFFRSEKICIPALHPLTGQKRITLTGKVINNSENIIFLVTGKSKAYVLKDIIGNRNSGKQYPASFVLPEAGNVFWYIDKEAGSLLDQDFTNK